MTIYNKTKTGGYKLDQLQVEINADATIVPSCNSITGTGDNIDLDFAAALSGGEETQLDTLITNHTPTADTVNVANLLFSESSGHKLAIHESSRPQMPGKFFHSYWSGAGDDMATPAIGQGNTLTVETVVDDAETIVDIQFHKDYGDVYVHEGYIQWENAGWGDSVCVEVYATATPLQQSTNLDYTIDAGVKIRYAAGGAGTGTNGLNGDPVWVPNAAGTGWWDTDGVTATFNATQTGAYDWYTIEILANRFINMLPVYGTSSNYVMLQSADTILLPNGYILRITAKNMSNTVWRTWMIMTLYREQTS